MFNRQKNVAFSFFPQCVKRNLQCYFFKIDTVNRNIILFFLFTFFSFFLQSSEASNPTKHQRIFTNFVQKGKASWYGKKWEGRRTANGEIFLRSRFTAAHRKLPFGLVVRVKNLKNKKQALVKINDRGPYAKRRIIDLSERVAKNLDMIKSGVETVTLKAVSDKSGKPLNFNNSFYIRVQETDSAQEAHANSVKLELKLGLKVHVLQIPFSEKKWAICLGPYQFFQEAEKESIQIEKKYLVKDIVEGPTLRNSMFHYQLFEKSISIRK